MNNFQGIIKKNLHSTKIYLNVRKSIMAGVEMDEEVKRILVNDDDSKLITYLRVSYV